jgi:hypothetical protein
MHSFTRLNGKNSDKIIFIRYKVQLKQHTIQMEREPLASHYPLIWSENSTLFTKPNDPYNAPRSHLNLHTHTHTHTQTRARAHAQNNILGHIFLYYLFRLTICRISHLYFLRSPYPPYATNNVYSTIYALLTKHLPVSSYFQALHSRILFSILFSEVLNLCNFLWQTEKSFTPTQQGKIMGLYNLESRYRTGRQNILSRMRARLLWI